MGRGHSEQDHGETARLAHCQLGSEIIPRKLLAQPTWHFYTNFVNTTHYLPCMDAARIHHPEFLVKYPNYGKFFTGEGHRSTNMEFKKGRKMSLQN